MEKYTIQILGEYERKFRELIANKKNSSDIKDEINNRDTSLEDALKLNYSNSFGQIVAAFYVVDDTILAIKNFLRWGLDGPTKFDDSGEKYLRLYGVLNSAYQQQNAFLFLYKLFNGPEPSKLKDNIIALEITKLRHKLGAHSAEYKNHEDSTTEAYVPVRMSMSDCSITYAREPAGDQIVCNIRDMLSKHIVLICQHYDKLYEKVASSYYRDNKETLARVLEDLQITREKVRGEMVFKGDFGKEYIVGYQKASKTSERQ